IKAQQEPNYIRYQAWCFAFEAEMNSIAPDLRHMHPVDLRTHLLAQQADFKNQIVSPTQYDQGLAKLEREIIENQIPIAYANVVREIRYCFREKLKNNKEEAQHYFYNDVKHTSVQYLNNVVSSQQLLGALHYYKDILPKELYQTVTIQIQTL